MLGGGDVGVGPDGGRSGKFAGRLPVVPGAAAAGMSAGSVADTVHNLLAMGCGPERAGVTACALQRCVLLHSSPEKTPVPAGFASCTSCLYSSKQSPQDRGLPLQVVVPTRLGPRRELHQLGGR